MLSDGGEACIVAGLDRGPYKLVVVEYTADTHNVVVCTLCSVIRAGYWACRRTGTKIHAYRSRMVREPRAVLQGI